MDRSKDKEVEAANQAMAVPEERERVRNKSAADSAITPTSGAPIQHAFAGAELAAEDRAGGASETDEALKRVAGNDRRV
jgi:hypothetical protein